MAITAECNLCIQKDHVLINAIARTQTSPGFYVSAEQVFENTVEKKKIARYEQFLLFPQCFPSVLRTFCHFHQI